MRGAIRSMIYFSLLMLAIGNMRCKDTSVVTIPFQYINHQIVLMVNINDTGTYHFLLDTGVDPSTVDFNKIGEMKISYDKDTYGEASGRGDASVKIFPVILSDVEIDGMEAHQLDAVAFDMQNLSAKFGQPLDGILGYSFLHDKSFSIDYQKEIITFYPDTEALKQYIQQPIYSCPFLFDAEDTIPIMEGIRMKGIPFVASLDTGSGLGVQLYKHHLAAFGIAAEDLHVGKGLTGAQGKRETWETEIAEISMGSHRFSRQTVTVSEIKNNEQIRMGNMGNRWLENFIVTFDYPNKMVYFSR